MRLLAVGTPGGMETRLVPAAGVDLATISRVPFPRRPSLDLLRLPGRLAGAVRQAGVILEDANADVLVGVGGYVCTPMYLAARRRKIPIVIHEANTRPGLANRVGARLGGHVAVAFAATRLGASRHVGMPMRAEISGLDRAAARAAARAALGLDPDRPALIVTGGSSGAQSINRTIAASVGLLAEAGIQTLHITGRGKAVHDADGKPLAAPGYQQRRIRRRHGNGVRRGGPAAGPLRRRDGLRGRRRRRARSVRSAADRQRRTGAQRRRTGRGGRRPPGGGQARSPPDWVREHIIPLLQDPDRLASMAANAEQLGIRDADQRMADLVLETAEVTAISKALEAARQEAVAE